MKQTQKQKNSTQLLSTAVKTDELGRAVLLESDILELLYQDKWQNITDCVLDANTVKQFNNSISTCKDKTAPLDNHSYDIDKERYDSINRSSWYMPQDYKDFDIESYVLEMCFTTEQENRVNYELDLFKSHDMMDVLRFLKYLVDTMKQNNIVWGVGRGSSVASYVLFLIGVHKIDSIKYNLDPTEFLR